MWNIWTLLLLSLQILRSYDCIWSNDVHWMLIKCIIDDYLYNVMHCVESETIGTINTGSESSIQVDNDDLKHPPTFITLTLSAVRQ